MIIAFHFWQNYKVFFIKFSCILDKPKIISLFLYGNNYSLWIGGHNTTCNCNCIVYRTWKVGSALSCQIINKSWNSEGRHFQK